MFTNSDLRKLTAIETRLSRLAGSCGDFKLKKCLNAAKREIGIALAAILEDKADDNERPR
jgi:hypothetical protein